jgi:cytochrome b subunit of formate dehydrogenase
MIPRRLHIALFCASLMFAIAGLHLLLATHFGLILAALGLAGALLWIVYRFVERLAISLWALSVAFSEALSQYLVQKESRRAARLL